MRAKIVAIEKKVYEDGSMVFTVIYRSGKRRKFCVDSIATFMRSTSIPNTVLSFYSQSLPRYIGNDAFRYEIEE